MERGDESAASSEIEDVDELNGQLPGVAFSYARADRGSGGMIFDNQVFDHASIHVVSVGFSVHGDAAIDRDTIVLGTPLRRARSAMRWNGREPRSRDLHVWGPGVDHRAVVGVDWTIATVNANFEAVQNTATTLGLDVDDWPGRRGFLQSGASDELLRVLRTGFAELDDHGESTELLTLVARAVSSGEPVTSPSRTMSSVEITRRAIDHLNDTGVWFPPIIDLCVASGVSERRLRQAFIDCYGLPPAQYLRTRALTAVRRELSSGRADDVTVTHVASDHGFRHLGDFSGYYQKMFGELPSKTLRASL